MHVVFHTSGAPICGLNCYRNIEKCPFVAALSFNNQLEGAGAITGFPRYFAYGSRYNAPAPYVRADDENNSAIVDPGGMDVRVSGNIQQWLDRVSHGVMAEMSRDELAADIEIWNRSHTQQLRPP